MMDKVFYSKPMKTKVKGPAPMSIAQYIAQVNRKPTPVVSMKNDNFVKNPQDVSFSNESDESQLNSSDASDDSQGQQQVPVMPENESEIEERMQKRQRGRRPGKNAFTSDPLNILGKIKPNRS
jgi:sulfur carrier protein ThiS